MPTCYFAPDWGMALRISGALESEFDGLQVIGGWSRPNPRCHGTIFAVASDRFPEAWSGRLLDIDEEPTVRGSASRVGPHPDAAFERLILDVVRQSTAPVNE